MRKTRLVLMTLFLTIIVFIAGMTLGYNLDAYKSVKVSDEIRKNELRIESYITEQQLVESLKTGNCDIMTKRVADIRTSTRLLGNQLAKASASSTFTQDDFQYLKQKYFISEVKFLALLLDFNKFCGEEEPIILYFYRVGDLDSERQGFILDALDIEYNHTINILSFDAEYTQEPLVELLLDKYDITIQPAVVIIRDTEIVKQGLTSKEDIKEFLFM